MIDLHRHLEGSHSPEAIAKVAEMYNIRFFSIDNRVMTSDEIRQLTVIGNIPGRNKKDRWDAFYTCMQNARRAYVSPSAVKELTSQAFREAEQGVDMSFSLASLVGDYFRNIGKDVLGIPVPDFIRISCVLMESVIEGKKDAEKYGAKGVLRFGLTRAPHYRSLLGIVSGIAAEYYKELAGIDVLGKEQANDMKYIRRELEWLREYLPDLKVHAGERSGPENVYAALELSPNSIVHGVRSVEDTKLMKRLAKTGTILEVCLTSNNLLIPQTIAGYGEHPLKTLTSYGVRCALGTDDPAICNTTMQNEMQHAVKLGVDVRKLGATAAKTFNYLAK